MNKFIEFFKSLYLFILKPIFNLSKTFIFYYRIIDMCLVKPFYNNSFILILKI
jgi:hypothetical protein